MLSSAFTPRPVLNGIRDNSLNTLPTQRENFATYLPHCFFYAERGSTEINIHNKVTAERSFGLKTFDMRDSFYNHQTLFVEGFFTEGANVALQRLIPTDALPPSGFILWADVIAEPITQYERDTVTGKFKLDVSGNKIVIPGTIPGVSIKYVTTPMHRVNAAGDIITQAMIDDAETDPLIDIFPVANTYGQIPSMVGSRVVSTVSSTMYKIGEFSLTEVGSFGNRAGIRLFPVTESSVSPPSLDYTDSVDSFLYRMQVMYATKSLSTPSVVETVLGSQYSQFSFDPKAVDNYGTELHHSVRLNDDWNKRKFTGSNIEDKALFSKINIFENNIKIIADMIGTAEALGNVDFDFDSETDTHKINFMTGVDFQDRPYYAFKLLGPIDGGINLSPVNTMMALGGSDGTMSDSLFDVLVAKECNEFGLLENKVMDMARFPMSVIYDTGFNMDTKSAIAKVPALRKDYVAGFTPWIHGHDIQNEADHYSACVAISSMVRTYTESELYATPACRYFIVGQQGYLVGSKYRGVVPLLYNVAVSKLARYMGAGDKLWKSEFAPDVGGNKDVTEFSYVNLTSLNESLKTLYFDLGVLMAQYRDRDTLFHSSQSSVYKNKGSVLNSIITVFGLADAEKIAHVIWAELVGNTKLTDLQYIEGIERGMMNEFKRRNFYDNRFVISVTPYYTAEDRLNGKSIHITVNMAANKGKDVFIVTINASDQSALST